LQCTIIDNGNTLSACNCVLLPCALPSTVKGAVGKLVMTVVMK
jgi:hypothetical protein